MASTDEEDVSSCKNFKYDFLLKQKCIKNLKKLSTTSKEPLLLHRALLLKYFFIARMTITL